MVLSVNGFLEVLPMKTKLYALIPIVCVLILGSMPSCKPRQDQNGNQAGNSNQGDAQSEELRHLDQLASTLNLNLGKVTNRGGERNMFGLKSDNVLFSHRSDSRTYFVEDKRYGEGKEYGVFRGSDGEVLETAKTILQQLNIPAAEIAEAKVITEKNQTGQVDPATKKVIVGEIRDGKKTASLTRQIKGIPVFSSHARIGLMSNKGIGFMELHWPEISAEVIGEAQRLQETVKSGWHAPEQKGAHVESSEAGIIHSPALGFLMDIKAAIRVIYASDDKAMGRKLTLYVDGNGRPVSMPRQFEKLPEAPAQPRPSLKPNKQ
jgi:hypothetical protein